MQLECIFKWVEFYLLTLAMTSVGGGEQRVLNSTGTLFQLTLGFVSLAVSSADRIESLMVGLEKLNI